MSKRADSLWRRLILLVMDTRGDYRRAVSELTGLPFSRARLLRRIGAGPLTLRALAESAGTDAPATTVAVNDLEARGLVDRTPHPTNRRAKLVSLTAAGRAMAAKIVALNEPAPPPLAESSTRDLDALERLLDRFDRAR